MFAQAPCRTQNSLQKADSGTRLDLFSGDRSAAIAPDTSDIAQKLIAESVQGYVFSKTLHASDY